MKAQHTPGPWRSYTEPQPNGCPIVGNDRGMMVAMLAHSVHYKDQRDEAQANARLIAAAPCMYSLLAMMEESGNNEARKLIARIGNEKL